MKWFGEVDGSCVGVIVMDMMYDVVWIFLWMDGWRWWRMRSVSKP